MLDPLAWPTHPDDCDCGECLRAEISRVERERDEARAEVERWKDAADEMAGPIERIFALRALLRELEWCDRRFFPPMCPMCGHQSQGPYRGHAEACRLKAALEP